MDDTDASPAMLVLVVEGREVPLAVMATTGPGDLGLVDALLRLHLALSRHGAVIRLLDVGADLGELLELAGVADVLAPIRADPDDTADPDDRAGPADPTDRPPVRRG